MGDDNITIVVPPQSEQEETVEEIGEELLSRLDEIDAQIGELHARFAELSTLVTELRSREHAAIDHTHEGFATSAHTHDGYAITEHEHEARTPQTREPDKPPEKQHPYFRKLSDL